MNFNMKNFLFALLVFGTASAWAQAGGDNESSAALIPALPFVGQGTTANFNDDYFESCPDYGNAGGGQDVVYKYINGTIDTYVRISICESITDFDSQLYVYRDSCFSGSALACQEDGCQSPNFNANYNSFIDPFLFEANTTYYIVIDGYSANSFGNYQLNIDTVPAPPSSQIPFTDVTNQILDPIHRTTYSGAPVAIVDMNMDGHDDIVRIDGTNDIIIDYHMSSGFYTTFNYGSATNNSIWAMAVADVNNDTYPDILVGDYSSVSVIPAINMGTGLGPRQTISTDYIFSQGVNFADIDGDSDIDVWACNDVGESHIYLNDGTGAFTRSTTTMDLSTTPVSDKSGNYASIWTDYDSDGDLDLYITKCRQGVTDSTDARRINQLFQNDGSGNYTEVAQAAGLRMGQQSWVTDFGDIDNDGDFDAFVMHHDAPSQLMLNQGNGTFLDITSFAGLDNVPFAGIQCLFRDFNNDGYQDLLATGGQHRLFINNGNGTFFEDVNGFVHPNGWMLSAAVGDLNGDGYLDVVGTYGNLYNYPNNEADVVWMNADSGRHYLDVVLQGDSLNYAGIGAKVRIHGPWGTQVREVRSGEGYGIMNSLVQHFGTDDVTLLDSVTVIWPDGSVDQRYFVPADQKISIQKGAWPVQALLMNTDTAFPTSVNSGIVEGWLNLQGSGSASVSLNYFTVGVPGSDSIVYPLIPQSSNMYNLQDTLTGLQPGMMYGCYYTATHTAPSGTTSYYTGDTVFFTTYLVGLDEWMQNIALFPNPAREYLTLEWVDAPESSAVFRVTNLEGKTVYESQLNSKSGSLTLDTRKWTAGSYVLHIRSAKGQSYTKVFQIAR
jgi:hypothetical protein